MTLPNSPTVVSTSNVVPAFNVKAYGARGDNTTDDGPSIRAAAAACFAAGGGMVYFPPGRYLAGGDPASLGQTSRWSILIYPSVHFWGPGIGGDVFADTDPNFVAWSAMVKLYPGAMCDLFQSHLFNSSPTSPYTAGGRCGFHHLVIDGNKANNGNTYNGPTNGRGIAMYVKEWELDHCIVQNCISDGVFSDSDHQAGYDHEATFAEFRVTDNLGNGINWQGTHDSQFTNGYVPRNGLSNVVEGQFGGSQRWTNVHNWGPGIYNWDLGNEDSCHVNCTSDGTGSTTLVGIRLTNGRVSWLGGSIYGTNTQGEVLVQVGVGDGGTYIIDGCVFDTLWDNLALGGIALQYMVTATCQPAHNIFRGKGFLSTNNRMQVGLGRGQTSGAQAGNTGTLTMASSPTALGFTPTGNLWVAAQGSGGNGISEIAYTGIVGNTFTGCTGGNGAMTIPSGAYVFQDNGSGLTNPNRETWDIDSADEAGSWGRQRSYQGPNQGIFDGESVEHAGQHAFNQGVTLGDNSGSYTLSTLFACTGVPSNALGKNGDYCLREDGTAGTSTCLYFKVAGAWTGIL